MADVLTPDICVIGAGPGGLSVAAAAATFGVSCVLIERGKMGGDCLNAGCVPSKALLAAARRAALARGAEPFGVHATVDVNFAKVRDHVRRVIAALAPNDSVARFTGLGVSVLQGEARFTDRRTVAVGDAHQVRARRFVIATGSRPTMPPISGLDGGPFYTNETIFDLAERPRHLVVIGSGPTGLELAQAFRRLGSAVTVLEAGTPLASDDPEAAAIVLAQLEREGVVVRSGVTISRVDHIAHSVMVTFAGSEGEEKAEGSHLLVATGRSPALEALNLDAAGIRYDSRGIIVGHNLKTTNRRVYAIGDVAAGSPRFTHAAHHHAGLVIRNALFRLPVRARQEHVPRVIFTDPELAQAGLTETQARARHRKIRVLRWPYHDNDRAQAERAARGHIKIVTSGSGRILGTTIVGAEAGELIAPWALAVAQRLGIRALAEVVLPYPTLSEIGKRAALDFFTPSLRSAMLRRIMNWLRILG
jgi:pyruvate/2-oxoglutarate dehydrogenase complex dihydrolipoamide dehydrogenase (E3) component